VQDDIRVEHRQQRLEVARPRGGDKGLGDRPLPGQPPGRDWPAPGLTGRDVLPGGPSDPAPAPARELPRTVGRAPRDLRDLAERNPEHVVQYERHPLGRRQPVEHDEQRQPDRVGQDRLLLGAADVGRARADAGYRVGLEVRLGAGRPLLPARPPRAEHVQAQPRRDRGQPAVQVRDIVRARPGGAQPGLLHRVVGVTGRAEHPVGHRSQPSAVPLEPLGQPLVVHQPVTVTLLPSGSVIPMTGRIGPL
jgi:hypothetical protein